MNVVEEWHLIASLIVVAGSVVGMIWSVFSYCKKIEYKADKMELVDLRKIIDNKFSEIAMKLTELDKDLNTIRKDLEGKSTEGEIALVFSELKNIKENLVTYKQLMELKDAILKEVRSK